MCQCKDKKKLLNKTKAKYISSRLALALIENNPTSILAKSYRNTYYCNYTLHYQEDKGTLHSKYCKNRWCILCNRVRTAQQINSYQPQIQTLEDKHFVTLTAPTVTENYLTKRVKSFEDAWRKILKNQGMQRAGSTNKFASFRGIRKMECTLRPQGHYHYHYHVIIEGKEQANWLVEQWLKHFPSANKDAQDIRPADDNSVIELFKYFTKLMAKDEGLFETKERYIGQFKRLDFIFRSLRGKRVFQPFGGLKKASEEIEEALIQDLERPNGLDGKIWRWQEYNWVSELGELLSDYEPSDVTKNLVRIS